MPESPFPLLDTLKRGASVLRAAGVPFALAGGGAAYARGAAPPVHDIDFVIREADADTAAKAFTGNGMRVVRPPEGWLIKAYDGDRMIDLIFQLAGHLDTQALLDRAEEFTVAAVPMPVLDATDMVIAWLASFSEHHADFAGTLTCVRPLREQVDWDRVRAETAGSPFAAAFLLLLRELRVLAADARTRADGGSQMKEDIYVAGQIERALREDPRTHELGIRVEMDQGVIVLRGDVASGERKLLVATVAAEQAAGVPVRNEVRVTRVQPPETPEMLPLPEEAAPAQEIPPPLGSPGGAPSGTSPGWSS
ncbi:MAG TPA: nucleotidyltransferase family protein [Trebonia sp.]